ncbi:MAG: NAD(P)H-dependent oxidoreductase [Pseudomonadota bacterium]
MESNHDDPRLAIVWHSRTGASESMAREAAEAAANEIAVDLVTAEDATYDLMIQASAYLFVCPENLGSMSGSMKEFFDQLYYPLLGQIEGRPFASIIAAGSDGQGAERQMERIVTGWRLRRVIEPLIVNFDAQSPEAIMAPKRLAADEIEKCREIGASLAIGTALGVF